MHKMNKIKIEPLTPRFSICKVKDFSSVDREVPFCFTGATDDENSLVCPEEFVPENTTIEDQGWRGFRVSGQLDFNLIGILAHISGVLADAGISLFAVSTFNTDYIFVKEESFEKALNLLTDTGVSL